MYVTLNISATGIRLLGVKGRQVKKWESVPLAPGLVRDGLILDPEAVGAAIDALFKSAKVPRDQVILSLTGLSFTYRILRLPRMKPALTEEAVQRGVRREMPLPLEELYLSWQVIGGEGDELEFFVLGVPENLIDAVVQTLAVARVKPYLMDLKSLVLARAANREDAIIVALEPDCFDIVLVAGGISAILHTITPRGEEASPEDNVQRLTDELTKTVEFYNSTHPENPLAPTTPLLLTGELAADATTVRLIEAGIEYPVEPLTPPLEFPPELPVALYATNMGLALKKLPRKAVSKGEVSRFRDINLNILSGKYKAKARPVPRQHMLTTLALIAAIGLLFPLYQLNSQAGAETMRLQSELSVVGQELRQTRLAITEAEQVEDTINEVVAEADARQEEQQDILGKRGSFTSNLKSVDSVLPSRAYFTSIEIGSDEITVEGEANDSFVVTGYATTLEAETAFSEVRIAKITEGNPTAFPEIHAAKITGGSPGVAFTIVISK
jgi:type IV pilus assembly protein PilM